MEMILVSDKRDIKKNRVSANETPHAATSHFLFMSKRGQGQEESDLRQRFWRPLFYH